jgi:hypothetical protein
MASRRTSKRKSGKRKGTAWTRFVTKLYRDNKHTNKNYTFKQAMKDAKKVYHLRPTSSRKSRRSSRKSR